MARLTHIVHCLKCVGLVLLPPLGYNDFVCLWKDACLILTDSGGLQEETTALNIPCLTLWEGKLAT